jgi:hypothetical protein
LPGTKWVTLNPQPIPGTGTIDGSIESG